jgi:hypothetical protein
MPVALYIQQSLFILLMLLLSFLMTAAKGDAGELNILYTGSLQGQLEPCGCSPKSDFGGIARIAGYLAAHIRELSPSVLIDAGNFSDKDTPQGRLKTAAVLRFMSALGYDTVAFMNRERELPRDFIAPLLDAHVLPLISPYPGNGRRASLKRGSLSINVSADPLSFRSGHLNILLTSLPVEKLRNFPQWNIIITSSGQEVEEPLQVNGTLIAAAYPQGKKLGIIGINYDSSGNFLFTHRWQPTGNDIELTGEVRAILADYDSQVKDLMLQAEAPPPGSTFVGGETCIECHTAFHEQWLTTRHAHAFESIDLVGKSLDPECVVCHVVGHGEKGGFFSMKSTPGLANVQCEACHGIGRDHLSDFSPMNPVTVKTCLKCHTRENSPEFDYPVYREKIRHW